MQYIETVWEKRNLGIDSCKFVIERKDDVDLAIQAIHRCPKEYIEVYTETGNIELSWKLEGMGFSFLETVFDLSVTKKELMIPLFYKRFLKDITYEKASQEEKKEILSQIRSGTMFLTDKIALNPYFGVEAAGRRYYLWMREYFEKTGDCFAIKYRGSLMGFEAAKESDGVIDLALGGVLPKFEGSGLSPLIHVGRAAYWEKMPLKKIYGHVSCNNFPVLRVHQITGFSLEKAWYVFIKQEMSEKAGKPDPV